MGPTPVQVVRMWWKLKSSKGAREASKKRTMKRVMRESQNSEERSRRVQQPQICKQKAKVSSLTQLYSVDFSQSRIGVKKCVFNKRTIKVCVSCC